MPAFCIGKTLIPRHLGCANKKTIPRAKFIVIVIVTYFITKFTGFTATDSGHIMLQILLQYLLLFENCIYLNLKVAYIFLSEHVTKLGFTFKSGVKRSIANVRAYLRTVYGS